MSLVVTGQPGSQQVWVKPLQLPPRDGDGGAEPCSCSQNGNTDLQARGKSWTRFLGMGGSLSSVMSRAEWPWRAQTRTKVCWGWGAEAPVPTDSADLLLLPYLGEDQQGPASSAACLGSFPHLLRLSMCWVVP